MTPVQYMVLVEQPFVDGTCPAGTVVTRVEGKRMASADRAAWLLRWKHDRDLHVSMRHVAVAWNGRVRFIQNFELKKL